MERLRDVTNPRRLLDSNDDMNDPPIRIVAYPRNSKMNPHMHLLYSALEPHGFQVIEGNLRALAGGPYDIVHLHWPEEILDRPLVRRLRGLTKFLIEMALLRLHGARLVWTVQNIKSHEEHPGWLARFYRRVFFRNLDGFISLSQVAHELAMTTYPALRRKASIVAPRGHYRDIYPDPPSREVARATLGLPRDGITIGVIGLIRPYKNIPHLMRCFRELPFDDVTLFVAGDCQDDALKSELVELSLADRRVRLEFRFIPESELPVIVRTLDLAVLPYTEILNSGSALLALSLDVPTLAPAMGTLIEVERAVGSEWVRTYPNTLDAAILTDAVSWARKQRRGSPPLGYGASLIERLAGSNVRGVRSRESGVRNPKGIPPRCQSAVAFVP